MDLEGPVEARLAELAARYALAARQRRQLRSLLVILAQDGRAPTAVRDPQAAIDVHLADSLVALELDAVRAAVTIADLGAGAGFPGLALAVAIEGSEVRLVESNNRKCTYLAATAVEAGIERALAVCERAEEWSEGACAHDLVVARALAPQSVVLEYAAPLLRLGGTLVDWRGRRAPEEESSSRRAAALLGLVPLGIERVQPFPGARDRHLHLFSKQLETPERFPRRAGAARKRPLGD
jgi:16S rRNA (guanine527-N7)-methyltransferase